jgi:hypothetical protein
MVLSVKEDARDVFTARYTGSEAQAHVKGIGIGARRARRRQGRDIFYLRGIAADLHASSATDAASPLRTSPNDYGSKQSQ